MPPLEVETDDLDRGVAQLGLDPADHALAVEIARALVEVYRAPAEFPRYRAALNAARGRPWFETVRRRLPAAQDDVRLRWWQKRGRFDSAGYWSRLEVPALVLIGERDETMDVPKNVAAFENIRRGNPRVELRVVPKAGHDLEVGGQFARGFPELVASWILDR